MFHLFDWLQTYSRNAEYCSRIRWWKITVIIIRLSNLWWYDVYYAQLSSLTLCQKNLSKCLVENSIKKRLICTDGTLKKCSLGEKSHYFSMGRGLSLSPDSKEHEKHHVGPSWWGARWVYASLWHNASCSKTILRKIERAWNCALYKVYRVNGSNLSTVLAYAGNLPIQLDVLLYQFKFLRSCFYSGNVIIKQLWFSWCQWYYY